MHNRSRFIRMNRADFGYGVSKHGFSFTKQRRKTTKSPGIISLFFQAVVFILGIRFLFVMFGVSPSSELTKSVYLLSNPFVQPFHSFFSMTNDAHAFFDWSIPVAMIAYLFIGSGLNKMVRIINELSTRDLDQRAFTQRENYYKI